MTAEELLQLAKQEGVLKQDVEIDYKEPLYDLSQRRLMFSGEAHGSNNHNYPIHIAFYDIDLDPQQVAEKHFQLPSDLAQHPIKVDCHCKSYLFGGGYKGCKAHNCNLWTHKEPDTYVRKTDNPNLVKNPKMTPYGCKHIADMVRQILEMVE